MGDLAWGVMEWEEVADVVKGGGLANIATASLDGRPHVAVVSTAVDGDSVLFATTASSGKFPNLQENPQVALMWRPQAEVYLRGAAHLITDPEEKRRIWDSEVFPYDQSALFGTPENPDLLYVRVEPISASVITMGPGGLARRFWRR
ncbi:MAG: Pyridoxamine 5-phosphate oxidase [Acidimicrobiaceae bacterium]|jgi:general stress protein 26|nr:Pyridoxamine 5-phosphate oxidase [Acidimicrobiaceae bacterium]